ncbi:hypothetical protein D3C87_347710 [compost metagenome]
MNKKQANLADKRLDSIYALTDLFEKGLPSLNEATAERVAELIVDNKKAFISSLNSVKEVKEVTGS